MIKVNGTNVEVNGTMEEVVAEFIYLADGVSSKAAEVTGSTKKEWLKTVLKLVEKGFVQEESENV